jgi:hypothetical protein
MKAEVDLVIADLKDPDVGCWHAWGLQAPKILVLIDASVASRSGRQPDFEYLPKPITPEVLEANVSRILNSHGRRDDRAR